MKNIRIIPRLDIKGPNVVKPVQADALRIIGNPLELALRYYEEGADELIYIDIVASLYDRPFDFEQLRTVSQKLHIPLTAGGGIKTLNDARQALRAGADKIAINSAAIRRPDLINELSREFGAQCVVVLVEAKRQANGTWEAYIDGGREKSGRDITEWLPEAASRGAGEIVLASIDRDGTRHGYDTELITTAATLTNLPLIAHGGASEPASMSKAIESGADAVSAASIFHYEDYSIPEVKKYLSSLGQAIRLI